ncbi:hypothetical protein TUM4261_32970 [Shewanella sp. c952]|uniref:hypothetical protein n=1 Tax=Shewanella sp. c952 TaxID=2815913 RepID=UPI001BC6B5F4|nr:hypothetical protein [Shewanella sp. c952]GIU15645.1 hypothetical protein TUM4261_32970 [Shewanella sp. c952]
MDSLQFCVQVATWIFLYILHSRTLRRAEISRLKEQIVDSLSSYPAWLILILNKEKISISDVENYVASAITRLDFQSENLNSYGKCQIFPTADLAELASIEINKQHLTSVSDKSRIERIAFDITSDLIENTEISYAKRMHKDNSIKMLFNEYNPELKGIICMLLILNMSYSLVKILFT